MDQAVFREDGAEGGYTGRIASIERGQGSQWRHGVSHRGFKDALWRGEKEEDSVN